MSPSADRVQCPFCLGHPRLKNDGTMYDHDWGRPGMRKRCPGAYKTKDAAKAAKSAGPPYPVTSGQPDKVKPSTSEVRPEEIF